MSFWVKIFNAIQAEPLAKGKVAFIWGPSIGSGYPYLGQTYSFNQSTGSAADFALLDTNKERKR